MVILIASNLFKILGVFFVTDHTAINLPRSRSRGERRGCWLSDRGGGGSSTETRISPNHRARPDPRVSDRRTVRKGQRARVAMARNALVVDFETGSLVS